MRQREGKSDGGDTIGAGGNLGAKGGDYSEGGPKPGDTGGSGVGTGARPKHLS
jgi:hypothetical protein